MATMTATASGLPTTQLVLTGLVLLAVYATACVIWPFSACGRCGGSGKRRSPSGRNWRRCRRCGGRGSKIRLGRRLWNAAATSSHRDGP